MCDSGEGEAEVKTYWKKERMQAAEHGECGGSYWIVSRLHKPVQPESVQVCLSQFVP